ncbi:unnamed protein product [Adineta ricciae]|uniref:Uncharacterized protein n=1 Tax=Adineta ricciae TaxID=249248 RepID=A0A815AV04_ADIRI|nr:unnamed protein product [Adineta ricciae]
MQALTNSTRTASISKAFDCSIHNCSCKRSKIGLVLYPNDPQMKNIILLICKQCYNCKSDSNTQHAQLEQWYFNIYKDSTTFQFKSRFSQNEDGSFAFHHALPNTNSSFDIEERNLEESEREIVQHTVMKQSKRTKN